jgi:putative adenylate-forming enzyme
LLQSRFAHVREVYQATEGLLAMSCEHGQLHLNEEHLWVEREWLDDTRFVPIVTDMARRAQPLLRYRLNDILRVKSGRCACGRASTMLQAIEGRCDDQLQLPSGEAPCVIFADAVSRILAQTLPTDADYELVQHGTARLVLRSTSTLPTLETSKAALTALFARYGVDISLLTWDLLAGQSFAWAPHLKRRRVRRENLPVQAGSTDVAV